MKKVKFSIVSNLDDAHRALKEYGSPCFGMFNGEKILSTDTIDEAYIKVLGVSKSEFDNQVREENEEHERRERNFKAAIPYLTDKYRDKARGIIAEDHFDEWDRIVPIRLEDLYHGMELDCWLELISELNNAEADNKIGCFETCRDLFYKQGHSGMSASLVFSGLKHFHPLGEELVKYIESVRV